MRSVGSLLVFFVFLTACSTPEPAPAAAPADAASRPPSPPPPPPQTPPPDAAAKASFTVEATLDMALARAEGDSMTFTSGGKMPPPPPELALFRVAAGPAVPAPERAKKAKQLLAATDLATEVKPGPQKPIKVGDLSGFQIEGKGSAEGAAVSLYQVVIFAPDATYTMQGRSSTERFAWYHPAFEKMVQSFKRR